MMSKQIHKFTSQRIVVTTDKAFKDVAVALDKAIRRPPREEELLWRTRFAEAKTATDFEGAVADIVGPTGFMSVPSL